MKRWALIAAIAAGAAGLAACEDTYYGGDYGYRYHYSSPYYGDGYYNPYGGSYYYDRGWYDQYGNYHPPRRIYRGY